MNIAKDQIKMAQDSIDIANKQIKAINTFNEQSSRLSRCMIALAIFTIFIASIGLGYDIYNKKIAYVNTCRSVYKELSYNKELKDYFIKNKKTYLVPGNLFLKDFQFASYNALLANMVIKGELAEKIMDTYRRLNIMQNCIESARLSPLESDKFHNVLLNNINAGLDSSMLGAIEQLRKKYNLK